MSIIGWILFIVLAVMTYRTGKKKNWAEWKIYGGIALWFVGCLCTFMGDDTSSDNMSSLDYERSAEAESSNSNDSEILYEMTKIHNDIGAILPNVEALYNAHRQHLANGRPYATSPAWGKWQDYQKKIDNLWDEYINLARKLDDNRDIIEEAKQKKRTMDNSFNEMFGPQY